MKTGAFFVCLLLLSSFAQADSFEKADFLGDLINGFFSTIQNLFNSINPGPQTQTKTQTQQGGQKSPITGLPIYDPGKTGTKTQTQRPLTLKEKLRNAVSDAQAKIPEMNADQELVGKIKNNLGDRAEVVAIVYRAKQGGDETIIEITGVQEDGYVKNIYEGRSNSPAVTLWIKAEFVEDMMNNFDAVRLAQATATQEIKVDPWWMVGAVADLSAYAANKYT